MTELQASSGEGSAAKSFDQLTPELFARLAPHLLESVVVVTAEGRVRAMLGPPGGVLGIDDIVGRHIFDCCLEEDIPRSVELAVEALNSSPGWTTIWQVRLAKTNGETPEFEMFVLNCQDDPEIDGFIVRLRELPQVGQPTPEIFGGELGAELERLAGAVPLPILFIGSNGNLYFQNDAARTFCKERADQLLTDGIPGLAAGEDRVRLEQAVSELLARAGERTVIFKMAGSDPIPRIIEARLSGLGADERVLALVATLVDVTDRVVLESDLRRRAASDALTGLINRNELDELLDARLRRVAENVTLLYVDLDGFKNVNDTRGHEAGDEFLVAVARILSSSVRSGDLVARIGGDEFVVVLDRPAPGAPSLIDRIEREITAHARLLDLAVSASIGAATGSAGDTALDLLRRADRAMYEVKRTRTSAE